MRLLAIPFACLAMAAVVPFERSTPVNPFTDAARAVFPVHRQNIVAAFAALPEQKYGFRPTPELMSFAELAAHIASANNDYCGILAAARPQPVTLPKATPASKADSIEALEASFEFCAPLVAAAADETLAETVTLPAGKTATRASVLLDLVSGLDHHYGQAAAYLRLNCVLPPTANVAAKESSRN
jgi:uncharacterized damage-inducible protein DinB